jgi:hypothetical protein
MSSFATKLTAVIMARKLTAKNRYYSTDRANTKKLLP